MRASLLSAAIFASAIVPRAGDADARAFLPAASLPAAHAEAGGGSRGRPHSFYFTRAAYSDGRFGRRGGGSWATDYPKAERQFLTVLRRLTNLDASPSENAVRLDDPALRGYPFIYAVEVGDMDLTQEEVDGLRGYLLAGGFLVVDDFWGSYEWASFEQQMRRVFPEYPLVEVPPEHPVLSAFYDIEEIVQVPNLGNARLRITAEQDGKVPHLRGIFDDRGRLMVAVNWNTDLGDAWEWAEQPDYPLKYSTFAYQIGVNLVVYAMSH